MYAMSDFAHEEVEENAATASYIWQNFV
jgi:hypothetical protein